MKASSDLNSSKTSGNVKSSGSANFRKYLIRCFAMGGGMLLVSVFFMIVMLTYNPERTNDSCDTDERVFDEADLLTDDEEAELSAQIADLSQSCHTDLVVYTDDQDLSDSETKDFTTDFVRSHNFGWDKACGDTVLLYLNMNTRYVYINTMGRAIGIFNRQSLYDRIVKLTGKEAASKGLYYKGLLDGLKNINWNMRMGKFMMAPVPFVLLLVVGGTVTLFIFLAYQTRKLADKEVTFMNYLKDSKIVSDNTRHIRTYYITHDDNSSGGGSGGGGGGGGGNGGGGGHF